MLLYELMEPSKRRRLTETGLTFKGYPCTVDCMGHQAGHDWATRWGINEPEECPYGHSNSFWEGCKSKTEESLDEGEGDPEGLPHLTPTLVKHIIQQVGTEGPHAISKSVEWGDGASRELTAYITDKLKDLVSKEEVDEGQIIDHDAFMDIYLKGKHQGELIQKKVGERIPNRLVNAFIDKVAKKFGLNPTAFVYGPCQDQVVDEMAGQVHGGIRKVLQDKGYKYLGSGIDKQAWLEPGTGQVLIVFGYRKGHPEDFSPDQRMFIDWINYCNRHKNNSKHLPRFSGFESFQFRGKNYIQARMEPLKELTAEEKRIVYYFDHLGALIKYHTFDDAIQEIARLAGYNKVKTVMKYLGGPKNAEQLIETVRIVKEFGKDHGYSIDLHGGNYMKRANGTIVVNDPFVMWLGGSGG